MAFQGVGEKRSALNSTGSTVSLGKILKIDGDNKMTVSTGPGTAPNTEMMGIAAEDVKDGLVGNYYFMDGGSAKVIAGGTYSIGDFLKSDGSGRAVAATSGDAYIAVAREAATAADELYLVDIQKGIF